MPTKRKERKELLRLMLKGIHQAEDICHKHRRGALPTTTQIITAPLLCNHICYLVPYTKPVLILLILCILLKEVWFQTGTSKKSVCSIPFPLAMSYTKLSKIEATWDKENERRMYILRGERRKVNKRISSLYNASNRGTASNLTTVHHWL